MSTVTISALEYSLSRTGLLKGRVRTAKAQNAFIRDIWTLDPNKPPMDAIAPYWELSKAIALLTDSLTVTGSELTGLDVQGIKAICLQHLPNLDDRVLADALLLFNEPCKDHLHDIETMIDVLKQIEEDASIRLIHIEPVAEQRYLVQLAMEIAGSIAKRVSNFRTHLACNGIFSSSDEIGHYINTKTGPLYY